MLDEINKALDGQLSQEELTKFEATLSETAKKDYESAKAFRKMRQAEEVKLAKSKKAIEDIEAKRKTENEALAKTKAEQLAKAKADFKERGKFSDSEWKDMEAKFSVLNEDGVYAFIQMTDSIQARREKETAERAIAETQANAARTPGSSPAAPHAEKKYDSAAIKAATDWGVPLDKVQKRFDEAKKQDPSDWRIMS